MSSSTQINNCRLCDSSQLQSVLCLANTPLGDLYLPKQQNEKELETFPLNIFQCNDCGHVQLRTLVHPEAIYTNYLYTTTSSLGLTEHFRNYASTVCNKIALDPNSLVVEIGSNDGTLLTAFRELGMRVLGIDPAREIAQKATDAGIPTLNAFFSLELAEWIRDKYGAIALFVANNVMANVMNPADVVLGVSKLLNNAGVFVFETGYLRYLVEDYAFDNIYHEHIDYYSVKPLSKFFDRLKMKLFDVEVSSSKGSSIRCYVQPVTGTRNVSPAIDSLITREVEFGYFRTDSYNLLSEKLCEIKTTIHTLLNTLRNNGKRIGGYGASVGVTTILHHLDLGHFFNMLIDDNPIRQGLLSPGFAIPVVSRDCLYDRNPPNFVVILAWRYSQSIIEKNWAYREQGGKFIRFLPTIEVI